ncbi:MAG: hypothetical protein ACN6P1_03380 [Pseudomonas sp.]|uniref:hypothetical protein n=1 Tax=Pseudomonas sp. TaxID=306 RepID=UPI003D0C4636
MSRVKEDALQDMEWLDASAEQAGSKDWLKSATVSEQIAAMIGWFKSKYEDPANQCSWDAEDDRYIFLHGGPYDPNDVLQEQFGQTVPYDVIQAAVRRLVLEAGDSWAPIEWEDDVPDYDFALSMRVLHSSDPRRMLSDRLADIERMLRTEMGRSELAVQLAHGAAITALESYLWDTTSFWTSEDPEVFKQFIATNTEFGKEKIPLARIFDELDGLAERFKRYLQDLVWHRLDKIKPMLEAGFGITVPDVASLMEQVVVRHHIIHRGGRDKDGNLVLVTVDKVRGVIAQINQFVDGMEVEIKRRFDIAEPARDLFDWADDIPF